MTISRQLEMKLKMRGITVDDLVKRLESIVDGFSTLAVENQENESIQSIIDRVKSSNWRDSQIGQALIDHLRGMIEIGTLAEEEE